MASRADRYRSELADIRAYFVQEVANLDAMSSCPTDWSANVAQGYRYAIAFFDGRTDDEFATAPDAAAPRAA